MRALAAERDWDGLEAFARERKPPVGFNPFIAAARAHGAPDAVTARCARHPRCAARLPAPPARLCRPPRRARRFIARLPDGKHKAEEYAAARMFQEAAECAARARDSDMLSKLQDTLGTTSPLGLAVAQIKERLQAGAR